MHPFDETVLLETRRQFFGQAARGLGAAALATMLGDRSLLANAPPNAKAVGGLPSLPHFAPKAKRAIYLHMVGAPPQIDLFDYKPKMKDWYDKDLPESIRQGQRLTTMTAGQSRFPIAPSIFKFQQHGQSGAWMSELLPYTAKMVDDLAIIRSMHTEAINHEPAITFIQTGNMIAGKPCIGAWIAYGLGSMNQDLPTFVVLNATHSHPKAERAGDFGAAVERGISLGAVRRRGAAFRRRSGSLHQQSGWRVLRHSGGGCWMPPARSTRSSIRS